MTTLLYSGNLGFGQDLGTVLRAAASLNGDGDLHILIVGTGKGLPTAKQLASELRLHNTEFREPVPLNRLSELLASGDVHIICQQSGTEGLLVPSKVYSTLAIGRPSLFIGPADCEVAQIIRESCCGFVVAPGDVQSAVNALRLLASDPDLRCHMGERARRYYHTRFGRTRSVAQIIGVIKRAGENGQSTPQTASGV